MIEPVLTPDVQLELMEIGCKMKEDGLPIPAPSSAVEYIEVAA